MFNQFKNLKLVEKLKVMNPKAMWTAFANSQRFHRHEYVDMLTNDREIKTLSDERRLEAMVREQVKKEFPNLRNSKTYDLLVDAVVHNIKKKQLQTNDNIQFE